MYFSLLPYVNVPAVLCLFYKLILDDKYGLKYSSLNIFSNTLLLHLSLSPNVLFNTLFSYILYLCFLLTVRGEVSHPYKTNLTYCTVKNCIILLGHVKRLLWTRCIFLACTNSALYRKQLFIPWRNIQTFHQHQITNSHHDGTQLVWRDMRPPCNKFYPFTHPFS